MKPRAEHHRPPAGRPLTVRTSALGGDTAALSAAGRRASFARCHFDHDRPPECLARRHPQVPAAPVRGICILCKTRARDGRDGGETLRCVAKFPRVTLGPRCIMCKIRVYPPALGWRAGRTPALGALTRAQNSELAQNATHLPESRRRTFMGELHHVQIPLGDAQGGGTTSRSAWPLRGRERGSTTALNQPPPMGDSHLMSPSLHQNQSVKSLMAQSVKDQWHHSLWAVCALTAGPASRERSVSPFERGVRHPRADGPQGRGYNRTAR